MSYRPPTPTIEISGNTTKPKRTTYSGGGTIKPPPIPADSGGSIKTTTPVTVTTPPVTAPVATTASVTPTVTVSQYNPYEEMLKRMEQQQAEEQKAREEMLAQQKKLAENQYNARVNNINTGADELLRQAYISKMQSERSLPQQLKAVGISGGASETTLQNMLANYANNRQNTETERLNAIDGAAYDRDNLITSAYSDFYAKNIDSLKDFNSRYNEIALLKAQTEADNAAKIAAAAAKANTASSAYEDVTNSTGYKYATKLLNAGYSSEDIYSQLKNSGYDDYSIASYLYAMGIR